MWSPLYGLFVITEIVSLLINIIDQARHMYYYTIYILKVIGSILQVTLKRWISTGKAKKKKKAK